MYVCAVGDRTWGLPRDRQTLHLWAASPARRYLLRSQKLEGVDPLGLRLKGGEATAPQEQQDLMAT